MNPYGDGSPSSSESQSQFGTARTYPEWSEFYSQTNNKDETEEEEEEEEEFMSPAFRESDFFIFPGTTQDKYITDNQFENNLGVYDKSSEGSQTETSLDYLDKSFLVNNVEDHYIGLDDKTAQLEEEEEDAKDNDDFKTGDQVNVTDEEVNVVHDLEEEEYEVFDLRIIHWKNRYGDTFFEGV